MNGTPLPHEEPQLSNPPTGVVVYYALKSPSAQPVKLELLNSAGVARACAASDTPVRPVDTEAINVQAVWEEPAPPPSAGTGMHRFALGISAGRGGFGRSISLPAKDACTGVVQSAAPTGRGGGGGGGMFRAAPTLAPGEYTVRLTVDGQTYTQKVTVKKDPREK